jgi:hypothetical protein
MTIRTEASMDATTCKDYFLQPQDTWHRRYEVLRAVFVDLQPMQNVAKQFGISYGTVRNWVSDFQRDLSTGKQPPFSPHLSVADPCS